MEEIKDYKRSCWEMRKRTGRTHLTKKQLHEAFILQQEARDNKMRLKELVRGVK